MAKIISEEHGISKQIVKIKVDENKVKKKFITIIKQIRVKKKNLKTK